MMSDLDNLRNLCSESFGEALEGAEPDVGRVPTFYSL